MSVPRIIAPAPWQLAADSEAPVTVIIDGDHPVLALATTALGLGLERTVNGMLLRLSKDDLGRLADELERRESPLSRQLKHYLEPASEWKLRTRSIQLARSTIMGIVNLTDDSFSGDGVGTDVSSAVRRAEELRAAGAVIIDVGAESARADRPVQDEEREATLMGGVISALATEGQVVSADTYKPGVARAAVQAGAEIVNDISGLTAGTSAAEVACESGAGYVLNYSYSVPKRRPDSPPQYQDVVTDTNAWFAERLNQLEAVGLARTQIAIDPGIAFGKSHDEDLQVIRRMGEFAAHGQPLLLAHSRKNYIGSVTGTVPADRDLETHASTVLAFAQGARIFRVHDVAGTRRALEIAEALLEAEPGAFAPDAESWPWRAGVGVTHMTMGDPDKPAPSGQRW